MTLDRVVNIADLRRLAERRLPRVVFDYIDGGADAEITLRENCRAFEQVTLRPRSAVATPACDLRTTVLGTTLELPFVLAPVGSSRMFYPACGSGGGAGRGRSGHRVYPLDPVRDAARGGEGRHDRPRLVSGLSRRWARRHPLRSRACPRGGLLGDRRHGRHAGGGPARARPSKRGGRPRVRQGLVDAARAAGNRFTSALAGGLPLGRRPDELSQHRAPRHGADAVCRRGRRARAVHGELARSAVDSRGVAGAHRHQGHSHGRRRPPRRRSRRRRDRGVEPRRPPARRRGADLARAARRWSPRSMDASRSCSTGAFAVAATSSRRCAMGARAVLVGRAYAYGLGAAGGRESTARSRF